MIRIRRGKELLYEGRLDSLRRFKDDVREVQSGYECGINISSFADYQEGDVVQSYTREVVGS